jgi:cobalt-zinc-cadmium efflux system outer membrane protein
MSAFFRRAMRGALLLAGLTLAGVGHAADPGMDAFVREVLARNPSVRAEGLRRDASRREASAEGLPPDPVASVMVDRVPERMGGEMPMIRYQVQQMVPWPGKLDFMRSAAESRADGASSFEEIRRLDVALDAKRGWLMLVLNRRQREINRISFGLLTSIAGAASARYGAGTGSHHELARAEVERNAVEVERVSLEGQRVSMVAMLNALRNMPVDASIDDPRVAESPSPRLSDAELVNEAIRARPEIKRMEAMVREMRTMADLARRERYPDLMVGGWFNQMIGAPSTAGAMVGVTIPVFGIARQNRRGAALDLRSNSGREDIDTMLAMIRFEIADASRKVETATRTLEFIRVMAAPRAMESFEVALASYSTGTGDITALLESRRALQAVELAQAQASVARETAIAELERALGGRFPQVSQ